MICQLSCFGQLTYSDNRYFVESHYIGILNRDAEKGGYHFQVDALNGGYPRDVMTNNFIVSAEFDLGQQGFIANSPQHPCWIPPLNAFNPRYLAPADNAQWVAHLYWNVFRRCADSGEVQFHTQHLYGDVGPQLTRAQTASNFLAGQEFQLRNDKRVNAYIQLVEQPGIAPTKVGVNLAFIPIDRYNSLNMTNGGTPLMQHCPTGAVYRNCMIQLLLGTTQGFRSQGTTNLRFFIGREWYSTALSDRYGTVSQTWRNNLKDFFDDLKQNGIERITPTISMEPHDAEPNEWASGSVFSCGQVKTLWFRRHLPYGFNYVFVDAHWEDKDGKSVFVDAHWEYQEERCNNRDYESAAFNTINFQGWTPYFNVTDAVLSQAKMSGLDVETLDYLNEADLDLLPVQGRLIFDNSTYTDVLGTLSNKMAYYGFRGDRVVMSTQKINPSDPYGALCLSYYGNSAMLHQLGAFLNALAGNKFGNAHYFVYNGLTCGPALPDESRMSRLPVSYPTRNVVDIHSQTYYSGNAPAAAKWAKEFYSSVWDLLGRRNMAGSVVQFGETNPVEDTCLNTPWTLSQASAFVFGYAGQDGYIRSSLYTNAKANVRFLPWHRTESDLVDSCVLNPILMNPPFNPY